jgi:hypothetical protein
MLRRVVVLSVVLLAACGGGVPYTASNAPPHAMTARTPESVEVFAQAPQREHVEVGSYATSPSNADKTAVMRHLRAEAADKGCDALVVSGTNEAGYKATCIVYRDSGPGPAPKAMTEAAQHGPY